MLDLRAESLKEAKKQEKERRKKREREGWRGERGRRQKRKMLDISHFSELRCRAAAGKELEGKSPSSRQLRRGAKVCVHRDDLIV